MLIGIRAISVSSLIPTVTFKGTLMIKSVQALDSYKNLHGDLPRPWNVEDAEKFVELVKKQSSEELDKSQVDFLTKVAFTSRGRLVGNDSALGGFIAQEVVKAIGQKYTPENQWVGIFWLSLTPFVFPRGFRIIAPDHFLRPRKF
jgi:hypothetical protein